MRSVILVTLLAVVSSNAAHADAIDGEWCNVVSGEQLRIDGPSIALRSGQTLKGDYSRHAFSYVSPDGAPEAGAMIEFVLRTDDEMRRVRTDNAMPEHEDLWRRCRQTS